MECVRQVSLVVTAGPGKLWCKSRSSVASSAVDLSQIIAGTNRPVIYSRAVTRHVVNGPPVMSLMCLNVLYVWNVVHVCRLDSLVTQPCHLLYDDSSQDALLAGRDPLLSRSLFEQDERQEVDLLFRELERILSPAPDRESVSSDSPLLRAAFCLRGHGRADTCAARPPLALHANPVPRPHLPSDRRHYCIHISSSASLVSVTAPLFPDDTHRSPPQSQHDNPLINRAACRETCPVSAPKWEKAV